jgi:hypothetical protein
MSIAPKSYPWRFFRAGGFDQVRLETGADLIHLDELDQKLWVALACPTSGIEFDPKTAALIDTDKDGRIRAVELIAAVRWAGEALKNPDLLIGGRDVLALDAINDQSAHGKEILASARRILGNIGLADSPNITLAQAMDANRIFVAARFNGDGIVAPECADNAEVAGVITEIVACMGSLPDRSGKPGIDQDHADRFFAACAAFDTWMRLSETNANQILPLGASTSAAAEAVKSVKRKVDDFFGRCRLAVYDPRSTTVLNRTEDAYLVALTGDVTIDVTAVAGFPLAQIGPGKPLPLKTGLNPAHEAAVAAFAAAAVRPLLGERDLLTEADWSALQNRLAPYEAWRAAKAGAEVEKLGAERVRTLLDPKVREAVNSLIAQDKAVEAEVANAGNVEKLLRYVRDLHLLCRNFVNFKDLYLDGGPAVFQCGTLFIDQRACSLCFKVDDPAKNAAMAGLSGAYLAYCDCVRKGTSEKIGIVVAVSQGDDDNLMVGRNGVFYDRKGRDYDATVTNILSSPISVRQAFWLPYKKMVRALEEYIAKRAAAGESNVPASLTAAATAASAPPGAPAGTAPAASPAPAAAAAPAPSAPASFDPSVVALLSLAVGSLAAGVATVLAFLGKVPGPLLPLVFVGAAIIISGPSLILAFIKLRKRNLGPILDANGWAINARAKINVPFGERLTSIAKLPQGATVDEKDKYAPRRLLWPRFLAIALVLVWIYSLLDYSGVLYLMTKNWDTPLGTKPQNYRERTNSPPDTVSARTNAPGK